MNSLLQKIAKRPGLTMLSIGLLAFAVLGRGSKDETDELMHSLCAKDGGMNIYETVTLPASEFSRWGEPLFQYRHLGTSDPEVILGPDYRYVYRSDLLKRGDTLKGKVQMRRYIEKIYRRSDGKLVGESTSYGRSGGDSYLHLLMGLHPSSWSCPEGVDRLIPTVFVQGK